MSMSYFINNGKAFERRGPNMKSTGTSIPRWSKVRVIKNASVKMGGKTRNLVRTRQILPNGKLGQTWDWTMRSNLTPLDTSLPFKLSTKKKNGMTKSPKQFADTVLRKAGADPEDWFSNFQYITFLGRVTKTPVHETLATHLKKVEKSIVKTYGGPTQDPVVAGKKMGFESDFETIKGSRPYPTSASTSHHLFGVGIDIEYQKNPYISESKNDKTAIHTVFPRAWAFVTGKSKKMAKRNGFADYYSMEETNTMLKQYFAFLESANKKDLQSQLQFLKSHSVPFWKNQSLAGTRKRIGEDLKWCAGVWGRTKASVRKNGFCNFTEAFIDEIDLHWGIEYGDMMHFDMRNIGIGRKIDKCRRQVRV